ncbi:TPA: hypothetical protein QDZ66_005018 [Pluralibacter gergoviae]|uniref:Uncharacterized protein n=1 Tax=Pluralibacter gergoviae TaxID=61647 RepID=A0A0J5LC81_PLUGE|nr:hypothetical protein ABW06_25610 [Pluralibacter gergoviae]KMK15954.1 hypothetical protein ABW10_25175 [Pluralibacter gergoviae]HDS1154166.1 hypothetical protein [Pluralibacter gergoviae]
MRDLILPLGKSSIYSTKPVAALNYRAILLLLLRFTYHVIQDLGNQLLLGSRQLADQLDLLLQPGGRATFAAPVRGQM